MHLIGDLGVGECINYILLASFEVLSEGEDRNSAEKFVGERCSVSVVDRGQLEVPTDTKSRLK